jgi:hypothetical protein
MKAVIPNFLAVTILFPATSTDKLISILGTVNADLQHGIQVETVLP